MMNRQNRTKFAPVKVGDEVDVKVEALGRSGDGIAKIQGFVLFVPNTQIGQLVKIKVTRVLRNVGFAEVIGEASEPQPQEAPSAQEEQDSSQEQPQEEPKEPVEDSEDFGEEFQEEEEK